MPSFVPVSGARLLTALRKHGSRQPTQQLRTKRDQTASSFEHVSMRLPSARLHCFFRGVRANELSGKAFAPRRPVRGRGYPRVRFSLTIQVEVRRVTPASTRAEHAARTPARSRMPSLSFPHCAPIYPRGERDAEEGHVLLGFGCQGGSSVHRSCGVFRAVLVSRDIDRSGPKKRWRPSGQGVGESKRT